MRRTEKYMLNIKLTNLHTEKWANRKIIRESLQFDKKNMFRFKQKRQLL